MCEMCMCLALCGVVGEKIGFGLYQACGNMWRRVVSGGGGSGCGVVLCLCVL